MNVLMTDASARLSELGELVSILNGRNRSVLFCLVQLFIIFSLSDTLGLGAQAKGVYFIVRGLPIKHKYNTDIVCSEDGQHEVQVGDQHVIGLEFV
jgi:hypothetical protein